MAAPIDLRPADHDEWSEHNAPAGWEPVWQLCSEIAADCQPLVDRILDRIEAEVPTYRRHQEVARGDLRSSIERNLEMMLIGMAERRGPRPEELRIRRELGRRRAIQDLPVEALHQAFLVGYRELWDELVARSRHGRPQAQQMLLTAAAMVWQWVHEVTDAVGDAYQAQRRSIEALTTSQQRRFVDALQTGDLTSEQISDLARSLGFDPASTFRVICAAIPLERVSTGHPAGLEPGGSRIVVEVDNTLTMVTQRIEPQRAARIVEAVVGEAPVGIGLERTGLVGARLSLGDAERALALASRRGTTCAFEETWLPATLLGSEERLDELLAIGRKVIEKHADLAPTLEAFVACGFSQSAAGRRMGIHTNTVRYRLTRWCDLTGWDVRTRQGLMLTLVCLEL